MIQEFLERRILNLPGLGRLYRQRTAKLKRECCLLLNRFGMLKPYSFVQWLATNRCNCACPFCESSSGKAIPGELSFEEAKALIDDLHTMGVRRLILSGGEPLTRHDIGNIMSYANQCNIILGLVTNGWFVQEMESKLRRLRFFLYFTSIDGKPSIHDKTRGIEGSFERALKGLSTFASMGVPLRIVNTVVHSENIMQLESMVDIIKNSEATSWRITPISPVGRAAGQIKYSLGGAHLRYLASFIKEKRKFINVDFGESHMYLGCFEKGYTGQPFFCGAGLTRCSIMPNGEVMGCHQVYDSALSEGNIRDRKFSQIWKDGFARFRKRDFRDCCMDCAHFKACQGGCWAEMEKTDSCLKSTWDEVE
jgi:radical SAM protein with 4Fe4S-binding SPASM domain